MQCQSWNVLQSLHFINRKTEVQKSKLNLHKVTWQSCDCLVTWSQRSMPGLSPPKATSSVLVMFLMDCIRIKQRTDLRANQLKPPSDAPTEGTGHPLSFPEKCWTLQSWNLDCSGLPGSALDLDKDLLGERYKREVKNQVNTDTRHTEDAIV